MLTLYAFSTENWQRPTDEVATLMELMEDSVQAEAEELVRNKIQLRVSGDLQTLDAALREQVEQVIALTRENQELVLNIAYNYGGREEIVQAVRRLTRDVLAGKTREELIDEALIGRYLYTDGLPDPDLLIRTGSEQRISNFLLWQIAYTELYFCEVYWPDFTKSHLFAAIGAYQARRRRFGGVEGT